MPVRLPPERGGFRSLAMRNPRGVAWCVNGARRSNAGNEGRPAGDEGGAEALPPPYPLLAGAKSRGPRLRVARAERIRSREFQRKDRGKRYFFFSSIGCAADMTAKLMFK